VPLEPLHLADFEITGPLGSGATSRVLAARHKTTRREVAIKMLEPSHRDSDEMRERLHREAIMLSGVQSPHVCRVLGFGYEEEHPFLVLERLRGETLADVLKRDGRIQLDRLGPWIEQLLIGVRDCHAGGIVHRDIKPANIFVDRPGDDAVPIIKLIDFGVARLKEIAQAGRSLTSTHHLLGSMGYMAPEQFQYAKGVGPQADVYAIGVVIFRSVTGRLPFVSRSFETLIKMKLEKPAPRLSTMPGVGKNELLDGFVSTSLQPHPSSRFDDGKQMLEAWWRVAAAIDRDDLYVEGVEVVFEDDIEVSTDVVPLADTADVVMSASISTVPGMENPILPVSGESPEVHDATTVSRLPSADPILPEGEDGQTGTGTTHD
jgi:serine/threonine-protein kinase